MDLIGWCRASGKAHLPSQLEDGGPRRRLDTTLRRPALADFAILLGTSRQDLDFNGFGDPNDTMSGVSAAVRRGGVFWARRSAVRNA